MHWFLKQHLLIPTPVVAMHWDAERASRLYLTQRDGTLAVYDFSYEYTIALGDPVANQATALVIDGGTCTHTQRQHSTRRCAHTPPAHLRITHLRQAVVPPPMYQHSLSFAAPIASACASATGAVAVLLNNNALLLALPASAHGVTSETALTPLLFDSPLPAALRQLTWHGAQLLALAASPNGDALLLLAAAAAAPPAAQPLPPPRSVALPRRAVRLHSPAYHPPTPPLLLLEDSAVAQARLDGPTLTISDFMAGGKPVKLPAPCHTIAYVILNTQVRHIVRGCALSPASAHHYCTVRA